MPGVTKIKVLKVRYISRDLFDQKKRHDYIDTPGPIARANLRSLGLKFPAGKVYSMLCASPHGTTIEWVKVRKARKKKGKKVAR